MTLCLQLSPPPPSAQQSAFSNSTRRLEGGRQRAYNYEGWSTRNSWNQISQVLLQSLADLQDIPVPSLSHFMLLPHPLPQGNATQQVALALTLEISRGIGGKEAPEHPARKHTPPPAPHSGCLNLDSPPPAGQDPLPSPPSQALCSLQGCRVPACWVLPVQPQVMGGSSHLY